MPNVNDFIKALLSTLGAPVTPQNLAFLQQWQASEGGWNHNDATFNPWNSTKGSQFPGINSVGVRAYPDMQTGLMYTKDTILNGRYPHIVAGLRAGNPFNSAVSGDLQTWVSGRPNGNPVYARKILGAHFPEASKQTPLQAKGIVPTVLPPRAAPPKQPKVPSPANQALSQFQQAMLQRLADRGRNPALIGLMANRLMQSVAPETPVADVQPVTAPAHLAKAQKALPAVNVSGELVLPADGNWTGTHVTDGLGWGTKTAQDIMEPAGTPVGAPEAGTIEYFHPNGAQGGGSMKLRTKDGHEYWLGHLDRGVPHGTKVKKGDVIAYVSSRHPRPHVHEDYR